MTVNFFGSDFILSLSSVLGLVKKEYKTWEELWQEVNPAIQKLKAVKSSDALIVENAQLRMNADRQAEERQRFVYEINQARADVSEKERTIRTLRQTLEEHTNTLNNLKPIASESAAESDLKDEVHRLNAVIAQRNREISSLSKQYEAQGDRHFNQWQALGAALDLKFESNTSYEDDIKEATKLVSNLRASQTPSKPVPTTGNGHLLIEQWVQVAEFFSLYVGNTTFEEDVTAFKGIADEYKQLKARLNAVEDGGYVAIPEETYNELLALFDVTPDENYTFPQDIEAITRRVNDDRNNTAALKAVCSRVIEALGYNPDTYAGTTEDLVALIKGMDEDLNAYREKFEAYRKSWQEMWASLGLPTDRGVSTEELIGRFNQYQSALNDTLNANKELYRAKCALIDQRERERAASREADAVHVRTKEDLEWITKEVHTASMRTWPEVHALGLDSDTLRSNWEALRDERLAPRYRVQI